MRDLNSIEYFEGVRVLVRVDFNVPLENGAVSNGFRITSVLPTIKFLSSRGSKIILISHLETREGENVSLEPVYDFLVKELLSIGIDCKFIKDYKKAQESIDAMPNGSCVLLENVRNFEGEKKNDPKLAKELASLCDIYVNDAFSVLHRKHASVVGIPLHVPSYAGLELAKEIKELSRAFDPLHPFLFILGGSKFETKIPLIDKFLKIADRVFIGGAIANDFLHKKRYEVGKSLLGQGNLELDKYVDDPKISLPLDLMDEENKVYDIDKFVKEGKIVDFGPKTIDLLKREVSNAKFILWNGPLGYYEKGYSGSTNALALIMAEATKRGSVTMIGGGDTVNAISDLGIDEQFTFVSTGGGAMLDFLAEGTLPGIEALAGE